MKGNMQALQSDKLNVEAEGRIDEPKRVTLPKPTTHQLIRACGSSRSGTTLRVHRLRPPDIEQPSSKGRTEIKYKKMKYQISMNEEIALASRSQDRRKSKNSLSKREFEADARTISIDWVSIQKGQGVRPETRDGVGLWAQIFPTFRSIQCIRFWSGRLHYIYMREQVQIPSEDEGR